MSLEEESVDADTRSAEDIGLPGGDFRLFVQKLGYQALIGLGVLENPVSGTKTRNLPGARGVLDDLRMIRTKTETNLEPEEDEHLNQVIHTLETHFRNIEGGGDESSAE